MEGSQFDVFLSFRGEDTRKGFTDHLYGGLQQRGVSTFRDSEGLKKGEKIEKLLEYIEKSKICIPIFSKGYADSKWCLRELAKVVECKKKVIPVFFEVDPSHVKDQTHSFASGFKKHESEGEVKQEELIKWRDALREVGNISGFTLNDTNRMEGQLVQIIVKRILQELNPHHLHVGEYIVGHESLLEELMRVLDLKSNDVRMIGIHGMGGIGKTTLVRAVHNKISSEFEACSFLFNVRGTSLVSLQQQLLKDIFQSDETFTHESKGTQLIKTKNGEKKVLIILDDVDSRDQLGALVGSRDRFGKGSRIIITTRDTKPLIRHGVKGDEIYELQGLNYDDSKKLFCYHAFGNEKPSISNKYAEMCDEALSFINGLPLALEVLGSQFFDFDLKTEKQWRGWLARLKEIQHKDIFHKLKLSYDSLEEYEKQVFLDIACFFVGTRTRTWNGWWHRWWHIPFEVDDVKQFWEECGFHPEPAIDVLKHKSLIKINQLDDLWDDDGSLEERFEECFEMHDQIRDMGRKIAEDEEKEGKSCSRLWNNPKVIQALQKEKVPIEGIMFQGEEGASDVPRLEEMDNLRLFHVHGANFEGSLHFPKNLKWLGLPNCQHLSMSSSVSIPGEVRVLDLHGNDNVAKVLVEKCKSTSTVFKKLKILDLTKTGITITPDFSCIPSLLKLTLKYCTKLVKVHESVGKLKSLVWLNFEGCKELEKLPHTISELTSLEFFSLYGCSDLLYLPKQLGNMTSLKNLDLRTGSKQIKNLPSSIEKLDRLEHLCIDDDIEEVPETGDLVAASGLFLSSAYVLDALPVACCRSKTYLRLDDNTIKELTESFKRWENLESLILGCMSLQSLPASVAQLQKLKVLEVCSNKLILADDALPLKSIEKLVLICDVFKHLPPFGKNAQNLKHLALECEEMEVLPDWIGSSSKLEILELSQCFNTSRFPSVCEKLKILKLDRCRMTVTPNFSSLPCLEKLMLTNCKALIEVHESIGTLKKLEFLEITKCTRLERLPDNICELHSLKSLDLSGCVNLSSLPEQLAHHMELLEELCLDKTGIRSLPAASMGKFTRLQRLSIRDCQSLNSIPESFISCLESLRKLHIRGNPLKGMPTDNFSISADYASLDASTPWEFMDALPKSFQELIRELHFTNERIEKLTDSIGRFKNVTSMLLRCKMLKALPDSIGQLKNLNYLYLRCNTVALFDWIHLPESLERLKVECIEFDPQPFSSTILGNSTADGHKNVKEDPPIIGQLGCLSQDQSNMSTVMLKRLKTLELRAKQMTVCPDFSFAPYLEELTLRDCEMLTEVHDSVGTLVNLKSLKITGCNALEGLPDAICHLTSLKSLELSQVGLCDTRIKSILSSLEQFPKLEKVCISKDLDGTNAKRIDFAMSTLKISGLCLEWVTALWSSVLHSVKTLVIIDQQIEALPDSIAQMQNLEHLEFQCGSLKAVPNWIGQLKRLHTFQPMFDYGSFPTEPDCIASLGGLQKLSLRGCQNIKHLPYIVGQMERLKCLDLSGSGIIELPLWLGCLTNLTHLNLSGIIELPPTLGCLTNLTHLNLSTTHQNNVRLFGLSHLTSLEELDLSGRNFEWLLSCVSNFSRLEVLNVSGCKQLRSIPHLSSSALRKLDASNCTNLRGLPDFSNLHCLRYLSLEGCNSLECIPGFKTIAEDIETLKLPGPSGACSNLRDDFRNEFMGALFRNLDTFKMKGNIIDGSHSDQPRLSFLFPDVRFNKWKCSRLTLRLHRVSSPVDIKVITKDDLVLFETTLPEDEFDYGLFSFEEGDEEILEHLSKGSGTIQVSTVVSELSRVELEAKFGDWD